MWGRVRSQYTAMCSYKRRERDVTGELSVSYKGVGIKGGGAGVAITPHFPVIVVYQSLYSIWVWLDAPSTVNTYFLLHV